MTEPVEDISDLTPAAIVKKVEDWSKELLGWANSHHRSMATPSLFCLATRMQQYADRLTRMGVTSERGR